MLYKKIKKIEDNATIKKIKEAGDKNEFLFIDSKMYGTCYYLYIDGKFYLTEADYYSSQFFPKVGHYEISFGKFMEEYNKFKTEHDNDEKYKETIQKTDKFINDNIKKLLDCERKRVAEEIDKKANKLQKLIEEAEELGIKDKWVILKNGNPIQTKKTNKTLSLKPNKENKNN